MSFRAKVIQLISIAVIEGVVLFLLALWLPGFQIQSIGAAILMGVIFSLIQSGNWWLFITFFSWLPVWLYPILTFVLSGLFIWLAGSVVRGVSIDGLETAIWIALSLTAVNAILAGLLSLDMESKFDRNVTLQLVKRRGNPTETDVPGFVYLEIDGLGEKIFRRALADGHMPTLKRWLDEGTHSILGWETDFTAQTGAMQSGILLGNNTGMPAYRWWDREQGRIVMSGNPRDTVTLENTLSDGHGLLVDGGASRGNMFSGDADESLFTFAAMLDRKRKRGPGFYAYLVSPFVVARLITRFVIEVITEWWQAWQQRRRKDKYIVSARSPFYAFFRGLMGSLMQDLVTYTVISDILRGVPAVYVLYPGYDDLAHFAGMQTPECFEMLTATDRLFARVEKALEYAPRPYHLIVLSDHGQSEGPTFKGAYGLSLEELVKGLVKGEEKVFALADTHEAWDNINAVVNESINADTRTARVLRSMLNSKTRDGVVELGPDHDALQAAQRQQQTQEAKIIVSGSGCTGLINFADATSRLSYEEIQDRYPDLIPGLMAHPGIGFVLVRSTEQGDMVLNKSGIYFLDNDTWEKNNPLAVYGPNAVHHLKRESSFEHCPDLLVNTQYDPVSEELCGFENQVGHHGGLGGPQNHAFIFHPVTLQAPDQPIIGAMHVHELLHDWRIAAQGEPISPVAEPQAQL